MRLWSIHPRYLDAKGLVALWREGLLAQHVLLGKTNGYKNHPQLTRFKNTGNPVGAIASYLRSVVDEADRRGYNFNRSKIANKRSNNKINVTQGQLDYEFSHLLTKLSTRAPEQYHRIKQTKQIQTHPLLQKTKGDIEVWEKL